MIRKRTMVWLVGVANEDAAVVMLVGLTNNSKNNKVSFSKTLTDSLCLQVAQMPRY